MSDRAVSIDILHLDNKTNMPFFKPGFRGKNKPNLSTQETSSLACAFRLLFKMYADENRMDSLPVIEERLIG